MSANPYLLSSINQIIYDDPLDGKLHDSAIALLNSFSADDVIPILWDMFNKENDIIVKSKIYDAILSIKDFDAVQFLVEIFDQYTIDWQIVYCMSFSQFRDSRAIAKLCAVLLEHPDSDVRYVAAESLGEIGDTTAITALEYAQKNDNGIDFEGFPISEAARDALRMIRSRIK